MTQDTIEFTINCKMQRRWIDYFCSMLKEMEQYGHIGHSGMVKFYSDGDGDFRPEFDISIPFEKKEENKNGVFDAG